MSRDRLQTKVKTIISGGQTGVDRGALDAAIELGLDHGGWCPRGRMAEDGPIPEQYRLRTTDERAYWVRTKRNVLESDGTLILFRGQLQGGTDLTYRIARQHDKPHLPLDLQSQPDAADVRAWLAEHKIKKLNVAGPRESTAPGIAEETIEFLRRVFLC